MLLTDYTDDLLECEWLPKLYDGNAYLAKFRVYPEENKCVFLLTDTKRVWGEVVRSERLARRFRSLNSGGPGRRHEEHASAEDPEEATFRSGKLSLISGMHQLRHFLDAEVSVAKGVHTDLVMSISHQNHKWKWELDPLGHSQSSALLSQQLIVPLILTSGLAFNSAIATPIPDQSAINLQKELDKAAKIARRSPLLSIVQALKRPRLATSLQRVSAVVNSVEEERLPPILLEFDEMNELLEETPVADARSQFANRGRSHSPMTSPKAITNKRISPPRSKTHHPGLDQGKDQDQTLSSQGLSFHTPSQNEGMEDPETLYTGPPHAAMESMQATRGSDKPAHVELEEKNEKADGSATESDSEPTSLPPAKKRRMVIDETPDTPSGASSSQRAPSVTKDTRNRLGGSSDSDSEERPTRRPPPSRGGAGGAMRVKQPIKRGGRRI